MGVTGVVNNITIKSEIKNQITKKDIEDALRRNWAVGDKDIKVTVSGHNVTLTGAVGSWYQKDDAGRIAWNAPGVWTVDNEMVVEFD
jgi:osmotically-inducible protein OsmY